MKKILNFSLVLLATFILWNSSKTGSDSESISMTLAYWIEFFNPFDNIQDFNHLIRKLAHFSEYCLYGLVLWSVYTLKTMPKSLWLLFALLPFMDETFQLFVPERSGSLVDVAIDYCGLFFAYFILKLGMFIYQKRNT
ncbi:MAG: VanZ family protein [Erysipelotrichaceae bacterium]